MNNFREQLTTGKNCRHSNTPAKIAVINRVTTGKNCRHTTGKNCRHYIKARYSFKTRYKKQQQDIDMKLVVFLFLKNQEQV